MGSLWAFGRAQGGTLVNPQADSVPEATAVLDSEPPARALRRDTGERLALLGQQLVNTVIDLLFLAIWAAVAAGQKIALDYFDAPIWIHVAGVVADISTFAVVACYITVDVIRSVRQMWIRGRA